MPAALTDGLMSILFIADKLERTYDYVIVNKEGNQWLAYPGGNKLGERTLNWVKQPTRSEIDALGSPINALKSNEDYDNIVTPGLYVVDNTCTNGPVADWHILRVSNQVAGASSRILQETYRITTNASIQRLSYRVKDINAWTSWQMLPNRSEVDALNNKVTCVYGNYTFTNGFTELQNAAILTTSKIFVEISRNDGTGYTWSGITTSVQITGNGTARIFIRKPDGTVPSDTMVTMQIMIVN